MEKQQIKDPKEHPLCRNKNDFEKKSNAVFINITVKFFVTSPKLENVDFTDGIFHSWNIAITNMIKLS